MPWAPSASSDRPRAPTARPDAEPVLVAEELEERPVDNRRRAADDHEKGKARADQDRDGEHDHEKADEDWRRDSRFGSALAHACTPTADGSQI